MSGEADVIAIAMMVRISWFWILLALAAVGVVVLLAGGLVAYLVFRGKGRPERGFDVISDRGHPKDPGEKK